MLLRAAREQERRNLSGALTGTSVPAGARVALVWRMAAGGVEVGAEAPIVNGRFSMNLPAPADACFSPHKDEDYGELSGVAGGSAAPATPNTAADTADAPAPPGASGGDPTTTTTWSFAP